VCILRDYTDYPTPSQLQALHDASEIAEEPVQLSALRREAASAAEGGAWVLSGLEVEAHSLVYVRIEY
jgi:hypothetical protein